MIVCITVKMKSVVFQLYNIIHSDEFYIWKM